MLRFKVYRYLGYLTHSVEVDLDPFDWSSVHFRAIDDKNSLIGTVRLIVPASSDLMDRIEFKSAHDWCAQIIKRTGLECRRSESIPILETLQNNGLPMSCLGARQPAELSRLVVQSTARGRGVARGLMTAVIRQSREFGVDKLFIECLPQHIPMFRNAGFEPALDRLTYELLSVPSKVAAMCFQIK